jgi:hypothetical protein
MDVKIEGKNVQLLGDPMLNNCGPSGSPANAATMMGVLQVSGFVTVVDGSDACPLCQKHHGSLEETPMTKLDASTLASDLDVKEALSGDNARSSPVPMRAEICGPLVRNMRGILRCGQETRMAHPRRFSFDR